jgi:hypothetical protein
MLGKRIINATSGVACTTDTVQILDGVPFDSIATYELESDASNSVDTGYIGNAAMFNGSSSSFQASNGISSQGTDLTFSLWFKTNDNSSTQMLVDFNYTAGSGIQIYNGNISGAGKLVFRVETGGTTYFQIISASVISNNTWHNVIGTWQNQANGVAKLYLDGNEINTATSTQTGVLTLGSGNQHLGSRNTGASALNGSLDEVRIYNTALTAGNVATLYAETASSTISISGLQAHYKLERDATDETGNYDGTASNITYNEYDGTASNVTYATGKFGNAAVFNGSNAIITLPNTPSISQANDFSWSYWVKPNGFTANGTVFRFTSDSYTSHEIRTNGVLMFYDGTVHTSGSGEITDGVWQHVAITKSSTSGIVIYVNGISVFNNSSTANAPSTSVTNRIGGWDGTNFGFSGSIDQVRIFDRALSAANVATLYAETVATASTNPTFNMPSGVAYYKMNDATDETGSYDGTATNVNFNVAGKFGNAGEFNGSSSFIDTNAKIPASLDFSVSFWMKSSDTSSGNHYIFGTKGNYQTNGWFITNNAGKIVYGEGNGVDNATSQTSPSVVADGNWNHVVVTRAAGGTINMYVNDSRVITDASVGTYYMTSSNWAYDTHIGRYSASSILFYNGKIDQVRIFDRAITSTEVETLYNEVQCIPTIVPTDHFEPVIYTGNGGTKSISTLDFQPDLVWTKQRSSPSRDHLLNDSVRGANKILYSNLTNAEDTAGGVGSAYFNSFDSDGYTVGDSIYYNGSGLDYVAWNWKAGGAAVSNTDGTITSQVSANVDAGFSIVSWTDSFNTGQTIGHGLGDSPKIIMARSLDRASNSWYVSHPEDSTKSLILSSTAAQNSDLTWVKNSDTFGANWTGTSFRWLAYCFAEVDGYSKFGSYTGTGTTLQTIVTGFRPAFVLIKNSTYGNIWTVLDNKRNTSNPINNALFPSSSQIEYTFPGTPNGVGFVSNGFTLNTATPEFNQPDVGNSGGEYIFMAFAEENVQPEPELANSFNVVTYTGSSTVTGLGFQPDLVWIKARGLSQAPNIFDSIRGGELLRTSSTAASVGDYIDYINDGFQFKVTDAGWNQSGQNYVAWAWKASNDSTINQEGS